MSEAVPGVALLHFAQGAQDAGQAEAFADVVIDLGGGVEVFADLVGHRLQG